MNGIEKSIHTLDALRGLMIEAKAQLADIMSNCSYFEDRAFNKSGKTRNILDNTLTRIADVKKKVRQLELVDKHDMPMNEYLGAKKKHMNECADIEFTVNKQWTVVQDLVTEFCSGVEPEELGDDLVETYNNEIES